MGYVYGLTITWTSCPSFAKKQKVGGVSGNPLHYLIHLYSLSLVTKQQAKAWPMRQDSDIQQVLSVYFQYEYACDEKCLFRSSHTTTHYGERVLTFVKAVLRVCTAAMCLSSASSW